jgi:hypothetical protein
MGGPQGPPLTFMEKNMFTKHYYAKHNLNGTEDEITIYTPSDRPMLCVAFWDEPDITSSAQLKADASLIVASLNSHHWLTLPLRWLRAFNPYRIPIVIEVRGGVVNDVLNLPPGLQYEIKDYDDLDAESDIHF